MIWTLMTPPDLMFTLVLSDTMHAGKLTGRVVLDMNK